MLNSVAITSTADGMGIVLVIASNRIMNGTYVQMMNLSFGPLSGNSIFMTNGKALFSKISSYLQEIQHPKLPSICLIGLSLLCYLWTF